ncbi:phage tail assembly chaperone [Bacillus cytotoxicus]|uniref:phage tail assembly chaperone n=1 Tax=Bacillus cytotoxicus TaxID=580165 RepID=UPI003B7AC193
MTNLTKENNKTKFASLEDLFSVNVDDRVRGEAQIQAINGHMLSIPFKSITAEEEQSIRKAATKRIKQPNGQFLEVQDEQKYNALLIATATDETRTDIKWDSPELAQKIGVPVPSPWLIIPKMLSLGGIATATQYIIELSGLGNNSFEEDIEAVKN